jgi:hypothetical protein
MTTPPSGGDTCGVLGSGARRLATRGEFTGCHEWARPHGRFGDQTGAWSRQVPAAGYALAKGRNGD